MTTHAQDTSADAPTTKGRGKVTPETPWLGLQSYDESVKDYFYGRDAEVRELFERVQHRTLTVLFGQSGLGKTSLLKAGLIPRLRDIGLVPILIRVVYSPESPSPQRQVIDAIAAEVSGIDLKLAPSEPSLWELFHDPSWSLATSDRKVVLIFDQFEELFTLGREKPTVDADEFLEALACLVENRPPTVVRAAMETDDSLADRLIMEARPCKVLLTLRDDFLHCLERSRHRMPSMMDNRLELRLLSGPQAFRVVFEAGSKRVGTPIVDTETAVQIVQFVAGKPGAALDDIDNVPPLLSLICEQLNERRLKQNEMQVRAEALKESAHEILQDFVESSFAPHPVAVRQFVEDELVSASGFRESKTLDTSREYLLDKGVPNPEAALRRLADEQRLLVIEDRGGVARVELTHDTLAPILLESKKRRKARVNRGQSIHAASGTIFISHVTADKAAALEVKRRALERGYSDRQIFLDSDPPSGVEAGDDWQTALYDRLKQCRVLIVVYSHRWSQSKWCFAELALAKSLGKLVFPIVIDDSPIGVELRHWQAVILNRDSDTGFERLWKALEELRIGPYDQLPWPPDDGDSCPYPGLMSFSERFAPVFFGRDQETAEVLEMLQIMRDRGEPRMLLICGGTGCGKSSLLRAGVLPRLDRNRGWQVLPTLRYGQTPNDDYTLLARLAQELVARFPSDTPSRPDWKELRSKFELDNVELAARDFFEVTQDVNLALGYRDATTLLPIDQFEELLTAAARPSAERFLRFLHALLANNNGRLLVIGTLRSAYLDVYERHSHVLQPPYLQTYRLPPFPWGRVTDVIVQPAAQVGVSFTNELLERLKHDAPTSDALPLLAFTLERLFRQSAGARVIELQNYEYLGGMTGAIQYAVQKIVHSGLPPETEALRLCFVRHLVQVNEKDEFVRCPARWSDLPAAAHPLLEQFLNERLLHTSGEGSATIVEVSHEALFRCWPQLTRWLQESRQVFRWRRDVKRDQVSAGNSWTGLTRAQLAISRRWVREIPGELSHEEIVWIFRGIRRERLVRATVAAIIFVVLGLGMTAWYQRLAAISAGIEARHSKEAAVIALTTSLKMFTEPTEIAGEVAAAVSGRRPKDVEKAFNRLKSNRSPTVTSANVAIATEHLQEAIRKWKPSEATSWNPEEEPTSEAIRQAVLSLATAVRGAWESQFPIDGTPEFRKARELAREILVESKYRRTMAVTSRIANGSREQKDLDALEQLYWSELVFLEDADVKTKMIKFRRTVRGNPEYSQYKLGDVVIELKVACQNALKTFE